MRTRGFTLIELLVAIAVMALLAIMSWRGLDGMVRARTQTEARADEVLALQVGLAQWAADLDGIVQTPQVNAIDWNGRVLRLTRRSSTAASDGVLVVAWTRRLIDGRGQWLRWQSPALTSRGALLEAWDQAALWAQNPGDEAKQREVAITALDEWQIFYYRADAWTNPLSSDATVGAGVAPGMAANPVAAASGAANIPDGVRLVLMLPPGQALTGKLTRDWVRPTVSGGKS
ncbi:MAG: prepilin-type N-terminal cleavage/methylation domain-containing protein [Ramlibacter sp.]|nr:prepilin-type N-terminal cleavage/methylation domain-containing protein [Ramlibacter sp.]MBX3660736.1 prepilin-type N-terminal cleavage/methylation domain-containing protein [Ramlibacter sp.]MCW5651977.1 prepilin-type N-terminal cleavage/methylation domain-containing protein [Ramlibacter sp.]